MRKLYKYCLCVVSWLLLWVSLPTQAAYQYTFISPNFDLVNNNFPIGPEILVTTNDFLKIVITSDVLLQANQENPLATATYDFYVGDYYNRAVSDDIELVGDTLLVISELNIYAVNELGIPTDWAINYGERYFTDPSRLEYSGPDYYSSSSQSFFSYVYNSSDVTTYSLEAYALVGQWQFAQISSPVPEVPQSVMLLAGLGILGLVASRRKFS